MGTVVQGHFRTCLDIDPDKVLKGAEGNLKQAIVIGIDQDGCDYLASSTGDWGKILIALETVKFKMLRGDYE